jgi:hypothetical protein
MCGMAGKVNVDRRETLLDDMEVLSYKSAAVGLVPTEIIVACQTRVLGRGTEVPFQYYQYTSLCRVQLAAATGY